MNKKAMVLGLAAVAAITGCSTKNYGRQPELTSFERQTMTCREIDLEEAKVHGFLSHVRQEAKFDGRSVLSFLGDFGIGNLMERDAAVDSANKRLAQLSDAKSRQRCNYAGRQQEHSMPLAPASQAAAPVSTVTGATKEQQLLELQNTPGLSYEEYKRRYRMIMGQ
ncbi:hypothetical protein ACIGFL_14425 [Pseudomonas sp. NPDC077649]|uniref:hypothetical protein n=1 Tax=Pseudomonas sp. NPDC077649 TaxID=3364423 RepID=UPI0037CA0547